MAPTATGMDTATVAAPSPTTEQSPPATASWIKVRSVSAAHSKPISSVKFSHDGAFIATASADRTVKVWSTSALLALHDGDVHTTGPLMTLHGHNQGISDVSWSRDGAYLVSASDDRTLRVWDVDQQKCVSVLGKPAHNSSFLFSGLPLDQGTTTSARSVGSSTIRNQTSLGPADNDGADDGHSTYVFCCEFNPQGSLIASGSFDETVRLWDVRTGRCLVELTVHQEPVSCVDFNHDGTLLATSSYDGLARIWDVATMQCLREIILEPRVPATLARFTPNSEFLLVGSLDGSLSLWDYKTPTKPQCVKTFTGHVNSMYCISAAFISDPRTKKALLLSGSEDGKVVAWDVETQKQIENDWKDNTSGSVVLGLSVHPTHKYVATAADCDLTLWTTDYS